MKTGRAGAARCAIVGMFLLATQVGAEEAQPDPTAIRALNNLQNELVTCANYFLLMQRCLQNTPTTSPEVSAGYGRHADILITRSLIIGKQIGMTPDAMASRMKMEGEAMMGLINGNCVNVSSAMSRYLERCAVVATDTERVITDYLAREAGK